MTSHLLTDGFVSGISLFLPVSPLSPPSLSLQCSKQSGKVALPSSCWFFCADFFFFKSGRRKRVGSGSPSTRRRRRRRQQQRRQRDAGPCGGGSSSSSSRGSGQVGTRPAVRGLRQSGAGRAAPSTRRDLDWLLWTRNQTRERGERAGEGERH